MFASRALRVASSSVRQYAAPSIASAAGAAFAPRLKKSTNITGIDVHPTPLSALESKYTQTLGVLSDLPDVSVYKQATTALTQQKLAIVRSGLEQAQGKQSDPAQIENIIENVETQLDAGQLEQVLEQANAEFSLAAKMGEWKAWEPLEHPPAPGQWTYFSMAEEAGEGGEDQFVEGQKK